ncbi:MAG: mononuclear molybdenum enzyme YedY, partial [Caulobacterales bacterium]
MLIRQAPDLRDCDVTDRALYTRRRDFITGGVGLGFGLTAALANSPAQAAGLTFKPGPYKAADALTPKE